MTRIAFAAAASIVFVAAYSVSPLAAIAIAAAAAAVLSGAIALSLRDAEHQEIQHVMEIIETCVATERALPEPIRLVS